MIDHIIRQGDDLFGKRGSMLSMWQQIAEHFYPERADFTVSRNIGTEFADHLSSSFPLKVRRDLGNSFGPMMRPKSIDWFNMTLNRKEREDHAGREWLEWAGGIMRRAMYDRKSLFTKASSQADHDQAAFGQAVKTVELSRDGSRLLFRCWHLRDVAWCENHEGTIDTVHRKWKPMIRELAALFPGKLHTKMTEKLEKSPYEQVECRHVVIPADQYDGEYLGKGRVPFVSLYIDMANKHVMEAVGQTYFMYVIPRWQTVSGSQYAYSPATVIALPDARLLQQMTYCLLQAGEKAVNPPMIAVQEALRSDIAVYAEGVTWVASEYDERLGEVLRPLSMDRSGIPFGLDMQQDIMAMLRDAFYLSKLQMPVGGPEMTAYEVAQRVQEYIREASPIFEPLEAEDNGAMCETVFELMMRAGAFGSVEDMPQSIRGQDVTFDFTSPLHDAIERQKTGKFFESQQIIAQTLPVYPEAASHVNFEIAFRDALESTGIPAKWMRSADDANELIEGQRQQQQAAQLIEQLGAGADVANSIGQASQALETVDA